MAKTKSKSKPAVETVAVSMEQDDDFFASRIEMLPGDLYVKKDVQEEDNSWIARKFHKNKSQQAPKQSVKDATKKAAKRRAKFESSDHETNADLIAKRDAAQVTEEPRDEGMSQFPSKTTPATSIEELRERLATKLKDMKGNRRSTPNERQRPSKMQRPKKKNQSEDKGDSKKSVDEEALREKVASSLEANFSFGVVDAELIKKDHKDILKKGPGKRNILNVKKMLEKAEENRAFLQELKTSSRPEDRDKFTEKVWNTMEQKVLGEKFPDPKLLKKTVKRIETQKNKSALKWASRLETEQKEKSDALDKRQTNIDQASKKKIANKLKRKGIVLEEAKSNIDPETGEKRRRKRPGFEGKHSGFLNDDGESKSKIKKTARKSK